MTVNQAAKVDQYPIPRIDNLFASLSSGKKFTKLDLSHAYQQVQLDEASHQYVTINTHKGLFQYNRLPFGVSSAPSISQRIMEAFEQPIQKKPGTVLLYEGGKRGKEGGKRKKRNSLHEDPTFSIHSLDRTGSAAVYFITLTTRQALARLTQ